MSIKPITINSLCLPVLQKALQACPILSLLQITKTWAQHTDRIWDMCTCVKFCFSDYCLCQIPFLSLLLVLHKMLLMTQCLFQSFPSCVSMHLSSYVLYPAEKHSIHTCITIQSFPGCVSMIYPVIYFILRKSTAYTHAMLPKVSLVVSRVWSIQLSTMFCRKAQHTHNDTCNTITRGKEARF